MVTPEVTSTSRAKFVCKKLLELDSLEEFFSTVIISIGVDKT